MCMFQKQRIIAWNFLLALGLSLSLVPASADATAIQFFTHEFPPFNFTRNGEITGLAADVVRELQRRNNIQAPFEVVPFVRGYMTATSTPDVALFFVTRDAQREKLFQWVGPIANVPTNFYARSGATVKISSMDDARRAPVIFVQRSGHPEQLLNKLGFSNLHVTNSVSDEIRMMLLPGNENTLALVVSAVVPNTLKQLGLPADTLQPIYEVDKLQGYIAFSKGTAPTVVAQFQKALDDMKRDGTFGVIYAKWFPHDKPPGIKPEPQTGVH
jgi:polar amino acid transport system substrate-binding protein